MTIEERIFGNTLVTIDQFGIDNAASFMGTAIEQFLIIHNIVNSVQLTGAAQMSAIGISGESTAVKGIRRETLRDFLSVTSRTSKSMVFAFPGIDARFRMPRNRNDADLLSAARAFIDNGMPMKADFVDFGLSGNWFDDMKAAADAFELSLGTTATARANSAGATAELHDWVVQGMRARRILDGIVKNVFANDVAKLAAWLQASHIELRPKKAKPVTPPTPPTP